MHIKCSTTSLTCTTRLHLHKYYANILENKFHLLCNTSWHVFAGILGSGVYQGGHKLSVAGFQHIFIVYVYEMYISYNRIQYKQLPVSYGQILLATGYYCIDLVLLAHRDQVLQFRSWSRFSSVGRASGSQIF